MLSAAVVKGASFGVSTPGGLGPLDGEATGASGSAESLVGVDGRRNAIAVPLAPRAAAEVVDGGGWESLRRWTGPLSVSAVSGLGLAAGSDGRPMAMAMTLLALPSADGTTGV